MSKSAGVAGPPLTGSVELPLRHWRQTLLSVIGGQLGIAGQLGGSATSRRERVRLVSMTSTQSHTDHSDHTQAPMVQHPCIPHAVSPTNVPLSPRHTFGSLHAPETSVDPGAQFRGVGIGVGAGVGGGVGGGVGCGVVGFGVGAGAQHCSVGTVHVSFTRRATGHALAWVTQVLGVGQAVTNAIQHVNARVTVANICRHDLSVSLIRTRKFHKGLAAHTPRARQ